MPNEPVVITEPQQWREVAVRLLQEPRVALDMESNGFHRYPERICLIQLATSEGVYLLDPLRVTDLSLLGKLLAEPRIEKVVHGGDYDLRSFDRDYRFRYRNLFDTAIASAFLGASKTSLETIVQEYLGIQLEKSKRLQRADWSMRPLSASMGRYAAADVSHLIPLRRVLGDRLASLGREEWVAEECARMEAIRYLPPEPPEIAYQTVKGSHRLTTRQQAVLRELYRFREQEALRRGRPPFKVIGNDVLLRLAKEPQLDQARIVGLSRHITQEAKGHLSAAIKRGLAAPPVTRLHAQRQRNRWTPPVRARLRALKEWRKAKGAALGIDPALVWPAKSLERLALDPSKGDKEIAPSGRSEVRIWQREVFGSELASLLAGMCAHAEHETPVEGD